jgi:hypothetical protein
LAQSIGFLPVKLKKLEHQDIVMSCFSKVEMSCIGSHLTGGLRPRLCQNVKIQILVGILDQLLPELHAEVVVIIMNLPYFEW